MARWGEHRGRLLRNITVIELGLLLIALVVAALGVPAPGSAAEWTVAAPLAVAMGVQIGAIRTRSSASRGAPPTG